MKSMATRIFWISSTQVVQSLQIFSSTRKMSPTALFQPLQVGDITLKNRVGMSALSRNRAKDSYPTDLMKEYYVQRAVGGAGLIITEGILVSLHG